VDDRDRRRLSLAVDRALAWHGDQRRKGTAVPYVSHLLQVAGLVLELGGSVDQAVAGLLHDAVEDTTATLADVEADFGPTVAAIVADCTDTLPGDTPERKSPWRERKERHLRRLAELGSESALVAACDKRHNLASLVADLRARGPDEVAASFSAPPEAQLWYYTEATDRLRAAIPARLADELDELLIDLTGACRR
jgi:(p)ppGpp synthase/HD superfamily hydrolase